MGPAKIDGILIVGGGAFGLSTALHLSLAGYTNITVLDKDHEVPPRYSAGNDINKIIRAEYEDAFYTELTLKAMEAWQTPLFGPHFHRTGFLHCNSGDAPVKAVETLNRFRTTAESHPKISSKVVPIRDSDDIRDLVWQYKNSPLPGWNGYLNRLDGYIHSGNALRAVHQATMARGVRFILGSEGAASHIVYEGKKATGIVTLEGRFHPADVVIVAAGAASSELVPQVGRQLVAKSWSVAHLQLSDDETSALRGIPVTYARDLGFFFEPDPKTNLLKFCPMGAGFINTNPDTGISHAPETLQDSAFIPAEDERQIEKLIAQTLPQFVGRPLVKKSLCWFADTRDSDFIVDYVPDTSGSVVLLSGDSGHGFKMFPIVGSWIVDLFNSADKMQPVKRWRWKEEEANKEAEGRQGSSDWGAGVSWRLGESREFVDLVAADKPTRQQSKL